MTFEERSTLFLSFLSEQDASAPYWKNFAKNCDEHSNDIHKVYTAMIESPNPCNMFLDAFVLKNTPEGEAFWSTIYQRWSRKLDFNFKR